MGTAVGDRSMQFTKTFGEYPELSAKTKRIGKDLIL